MTKFRQITPKYNILSRIFYYGGKIWKGTVLKDNRPQLY